MSVDLRAENLYKTFAGRTVVGNVSLELHAGEVVGLLGPNGAGKTTSFYMIVGLIPVDKGKIFFEGEEITTFPIHIRAQKGIGYLPQEPSIFRDLTVEENIYAAIEGRPLASREKRAILNDLLQEFGLTHIRRSKGRELSGGERRRVEIARTLSLSPKFILLDEPFAGVDPLAISDIQTIVRQLKEKGIGILITDHNVRETLGVVDRAYIMNGGELLEKGTPEEILASENARKFYLGEEFKM